MEIAPSRIRVSEEDLRECNLSVQDSYALVSYDFFLLFRYIVVGLSIYDLINKDEKGSAVMVSKK